MGYFAHLEVQWLAEHVNSVRQTIRNVQEEVLCGYKCVAIRKYPNLEGGVFARDTNSDDWSHCVTLTLPMIYKQFQK